ncbi:hypothetical protein IWQ60_001914 [Tieghemiomyces parasiticus]|uniref:Damage-control phosphatase ARMT1-like metal-binding domain-containing protein n=1 Tax=Tieghemiomyces parasiticus TaxID=78921 RepID=A0A9W8DXV3_9FUNG|nr:hypothetical protein IWQ60_001914 [Tieghemiomyces parasiticus]
MAEPKPVKPLSPVKGTDDADEQVHTPNGSHHISLPDQPERSPRIAVDIGGSLTKVIYFSRHPSSPGGRLNFTWFETDHIDQCIDFIGQLLKHWDSASSSPSLTPSVSRRSKDPAAGSVPSSPSSPVHPNLLPLGPSELTVPAVAEAEAADGSPPRETSQTDKENRPLPRHIIKATGGGAHLFHKLFVERLGVILQKEDEMGCLVTGLNFFITKVPDEVFTYSQEAPMCFQTTPAELFPYMLVNIGSGVSILKVVANDQYERISGTSLGGGTLWGLLTLLTKARTFDEMLELSKAGDNRNVDMLVGDIYGAGYDKIGLKSTTIASSMGKVFRKKLAQEANFNDSDISRSLLYMVSNNIGQIAYLNARIHGISRIYFGGSFIQGHPDTMHTLSYAIRFWSKATMEALFLRHEGYLGAMGAYLQRRDRKSRAGSFYENFTISRTIVDSSLSAYGSLDQAPAALQPFPRLASASAYRPDTTDLTPPTAHAYWIDLLNRRQPHLKTLAAESAMALGDTEAVAKADRFDRLYRAHLQRLRQQPLAYGPITIRHLMALREQCLQEVGFRDIFADIKAAETTAALQTLPKLLADLAPVTDPAARLHILIENVLAGNMFDWGSNAIVDLINSGELDFDSARAKVRRHALYDNRDAFITKWLTPTPNEGGAPQYRQAVVFVDNSGADIVLGILPFVLHLANHGTRVIVACNSHPAVNDVTDYELRETLDRARDFVPTLGAHLDNEIIRIMGTGNATPCLDLSRLDEALVAACHDVDLVILEGMGRAIHTNFRAQFNCDSLKLAVFKNDVTAHTLGAELYDAICIFEEPKHEFREPKNN